MKFEEEMEMKHFSHQHPLRLLEKMGDRDNISFGCCGTSYSSSVADNQVYGCEVCNYFIHQSCSEIPREIRHFYHPQHALTLKTGEKETYFSRCTQCVACYKTCGGFIRYECVECPDFHMDIECALLPTKLEYSESLRYRHHGHPLTLSQSNNEDEYDAFGCIICNKLRKGTRYKCDRCHIYFDESCTKVELPPEIRHFYHPEHTLKFKTGEDPSCYFRCAACYKEYDGFRYQCVICPGINMDIECALLPTKLEYSDSLHYQHHGHPLTLFQSNTDTDVNNNEDGGFRCIICGTPCEGTIYKCDRCDIYIEESCTKDEIPQEISHYFHPHPLKPLRNATTVPVRKFVRCRACRTRKCPSFCFQCMECDNFFMDFGCALLPDMLIQDGSVDHINHFLHGHPLLLCDSDETSEILCTGCEEPCFDPTYGCFTCGFFLHQSCARLPQQIDHLFHPQHSLILMIDDDHDDDCKVCGERPPGDCLRYSCLNCEEYYLHAKCASVPNPTIKFEAHDHALILYNVHFGWWCGDPLCCDVCGHKLLDGSLVFRCTTCDYYLHLLCGPPPRTIKDKCHIDPLKLMDAFVEDYNETDEVYCDACEQLRDPDEPVYYCKECNFITEIKCVMNEVVHSLKGHRGKVKLRTLGKDKIWIGGTANNDLCVDNLEENIETDSDTEIKDVWGKYSEVKLGVCYSGDKFCTDEERDKVDEIFGEVERLVPSMRIRREIHKVSDSQSYSEEIIRCLMEKIEQSMSFCEEDFRPQLFECEIVGIGELMIFEEVASYLKGLLHAYGDFTANSSLEPRVKIYFLNPLCKSVRTMCTTNVREVDEIMLGRWWMLLLMVKQAGFEIQFMIDRLSKITLGFFGRQVKAMYAKTKCQIDETRHAVKEMEDKLNAEKRELEELELSLVSQRKAMEYERTPAMKACLEYESEFKWKKVYEGSPVMFRKFPNQPKLKENGGGGEEEDVGS